MTKPATRRGAAAKQQKPLTTKPAAAQKREPVNNTTTVAKRLGLGSPVGHRRQRSLSRLAASPSRARAITAS